MDLQNGRSGGMWGTEPSSQKVVQHLEQNQIGQGVDTSIVETPQQLNQIPKTSIHTNKHDPFFPHHGRRSMDSTAMGSGGSTMKRALRKRL